MTCIRLPKRQTFQPKTQTANSQYVTLYTYKLRVVVRVALYPSVGTGYPLFLLSVLRLSTQLKIFPIFHDLNTPKTDYFQLKNRSKNTPIYYTKNYTICEYNYIKIKLPHVRFPLFSLFRRSIYPNCILRSLKWSYFTSCFLIIGQHCQTRNVLFGDYHFHSLTCQLDHVVY